MSRMYFATFENVAIAAAQDIFEIVAAAGKNVRFHGFMLANVGGTADAGDAQEEMLRLQIRRGQTVSGSGGSSVTPVPMSVTDAAFGGTCEANNTTQAGTGTIVVLHADGWNIRSPYIWLPPDKLQPELTGSERMTVEVVAAPADSITCSGTCWMEEFG